jgi:uncharacterized protein with NRDE domain
VCLIVVAHRVSEWYPLIIAANRDEDYDRPTRPAHRWEEAPDVIGGRDVLHGGSWLAITQQGRVAAVTNLRGAVRPDAKSRGLLVRDFVMSDRDPVSYAEEVQHHASEYAGFHLIVGEIGGKFVHLADELRVFDSGILGVSNGPADARWEKIDIAVEHVRGAMETASASDLAGDLIEFLGKPTGDTIEKTVFVASERYGTRSSTAIVATGDEILFVEQNYERGGYRDRSRSNSFRLRATRRR